MNPLNPAATPSDISNRWPIGAEHTGKTAPTAPPANPYVGEARKREGSAAPEDLKKAATNVKNAVQSSQNQAGHYAKIATRIVGRIGALAPGMALLTLGKIAAFSSCLTTGGAVMVTAPLAGLTKGGGKSLGERNSGLIERLGKFEAVGLKASRPFGQLGAKLVGYSLNKDNVKNINTKVDNSIGKVGTAVGAGAGATLLATAALPTITSMAVAFLPLMVVAGAGYGIYRAAATHH